jgi:hypothetical protein
MQALAATGLCDRFFGCYLVAEYRLVSANIVHCYFEVNATRETSKSRPRNQKTHTPQIPNMPTHQSPEDLSL